jgi:hypothetical protein
VTARSGDEQNVCQILSGRAALKWFAGFKGTTQSQQHIRPLHWYVACRLALEGGFLPDEITPRPPFVVATKAGSPRLSYDPQRATGGEATVLGGLKTKNVDVVVTKPGIGPVMAISCKGMTGAFRNLTNRMEETIGECTNLHITYPAMVFGYMFVMRANRQVEDVASEAGSENLPPAARLEANDIAIQKGGEPVESIIRFHAALRDLTGRRGIRNDVSRYEAVALAMVETDGRRTGSILPAFPAFDSPLRWEQFFQTLYLRYDERYVYSAPDLKSVTRRIAWSEDSPIVDTEPCKSLDYGIRLSG